MDSETTQTHLITKVHAKYQLAQNQSNAMIPQLEVGLVWAAVCELGTDLIHVRDADSVRPAAGVNAVSLTADE